MGKKKQKRGEQANNDKAGRVADRVDVVERMLARQLRPVQIEKFCVKEYGVSERQAREYITRARVNIRERRQDVDTLVDEHLMFLREIVADDETPPAAKVQAIRTINDMLGLKAPQRIDLGMAPGQGPLVTLQQILIASATGDGCRIIGEAEVDAEVVRVLALQGGGDQEGADQDAGDDQEGGGQE